MKSLPWVPQVAIIDAMFIVNTRPLRRTKTVAEYAHLLFDRFALEHFKGGVKEVHLIFDKPGRQTFNPSSLNKPNNIPREKCANNMNIYPFHSTIKHTPRVA